jgi:hypothetical protein
VVFQWERWPAFAARAKREEIALGLAFLGVFSLIGCGASTHREPDEGKAGSNDAVDDEAQSDGWCYAARSPACGPAASDEVTAACESGQRFKLQGGAALSSDETLLLICNSLSCE